MSRINREDVIFDKCIVHARVQFNNGEYHFTRKVHYYLWQKIAKRYLKKFSQTIKIMDYKWMNSHAHFIIKVKKAEDLSKFMHDVCWRFSIEFNKVESRKGHLFLGRFKASVIDNNEYLLNCRRYIYRNSIRAGMVVSVEESENTSYHCYAWGNPCELIIVEPFDELYFSGTIENQRKQFREYVCKMTRQEEENTKMKLKKVVRYK